MDDLDLVLLVLGGVLVVVFVDGYVGCEVRG
jgi:hypothetical protein